MVPSSVDEGNEGTHVVYHYTELDPQMVIKGRMQRRLDRVQRRMA